MGIMRDHQNCCSLWHARNPQARSSQSRGRAPCNKISIDLVELLWITNIGRGARVVRCNINGCHAMVEVVSGWMAHLSNFALNNMVGDMLHAATLVWVRQGRNLQHLLATRAFDLLFSQTATKICHLCCAIGHWPYNSGSHLFGIWHCVCPNLTALFVYVRSTRHMLTHC